MNWDMLKSFIVSSLVLGLVLAGPVAAHAQAVSPSPSGNVVQAQANFDPAAATQVWLATLPRDQREKSDAYFEGTYWLLLWNFLLTVAISLLLLWSHTSARLRDFAER
ncbi:MAG TPA: hypothetical protein VIW21_13520, partial [Chthoniobacterales bacterium]